MWRVRTVTPWAPSTPPIDINVYPLVFVVKSTIIRGGLYPRIAGFWLCAIAILGVVVAILSEDVGAMLILFAWSTGMLALGVRHVRVAAIVSNEELRIRNVFRSHRALLQDVGDVKFDLESHGIGLVPRKRWMSSVRTEDGRVLFVEATEAGLYQRESPLEEKAATPGGGTAPCLS